MPNFRPGEDFEPSLDTKKLWKFTRKSPTIYYGIDNRLPGLFPPNNLWMDSIFFLVVLVCEIIGLIFLTDPDYGGIPGVFILFAFVLDFILAVARHFPEGKICELQNQLAALGLPSRRPDRPIELDSKFVDDTDDEDILPRVDNMYSSIGRRQKWQYFLTGLIFLVAGLKLWGFYGGYPYLDPITMLVACLYLLAAGLHSFCTGYFIWGVLTETFFYKDRRAFLKRKDHLIRGFKYTAIKTNGESIRSYKSDDRHRIIRVGLLQIDSVTDWGALCSILSYGMSQSAGPKKRIWQTLPMSIKTIIQTAMPLFSSGKNLTPIQKLDIIESFNEILENPDLFQESDFSTNLDYLNTSISAKSDKELPLKSFLKNNKELNLSTQTIQEINFSLIRYFYSSSDDSYSIVTAISADLSGSDQNEYMLATWGVLTDQQLVKLINSQEGNIVANEIIARRGIKAQLNILAAAPT